MDVPIWVWTLSVGLVLAALLVDVLVSHRDAHAVTMREATISSVVRAGGNAGGESLAGAIPCCTHLTVGLAAVPAAARLDDPDPTLTTTGA